MQFNFLLLVFFFFYSTANGMQHDKQEGIEIINKILALKFEYRGEDLIKKVVSISGELQCNDQKIMEHLESHNYDFSNYSGDHIVTISLNKDNKRSLRESILGAACVPLELERYSNLCEELLIKNGYDSDSPNILKAKIFSYTQYGYNYALCDWSKSKYLSSTLCSAHPFIRWLGEQKFSEPYKTYFIKVDNFFDPEKFKVLMESSYLPPVYEQSSSINRRQYYVDLLELLDPYFYEENKYFRTTENCLKDSHNSNECKDCLKAGYDRLLDFSEMKREGGTDSLIKYVKEFKDCWSDRTKAILEDILAKREYESIFGKNSIEKEGSLSESSQSLRQALTAKSHKQDHDKMVKQKRSLVMQEKRHESSEESDKSESD